VKLLVRADASAEIGSGHLLRCLALAQAWRGRGGEAIFATSPGRGALAERLVEEGFAVEPWAAKTGSERDCRETAERAGELGATWVVVDGYRFGAGYQRRLKDAGLALLWLDDDARTGSYCADLVLDQNVYADECKYRDRGPGTRLLLGSRWALLRREFLDRGSARDRSRPVERILVTTGGADPGALARKIARGIVSSADRAVEIVVVAGALASRDPELEALEVSGAIEIRRDVRDMAELMAGADLAIAAAGSTLWELAFMGLPVLAVSVAPNQRPAAEAMSALGAAIDLGTAESLRGDDLAQAVRALLDEPPKRVELARRSRELVDGRGAERVVDVLLEKGI